MAKRFTFSDAKAKIKELEEQIKKKAGDAILDTSDNVFVKDSRTGLSISSYKIQ